jgi:putative peptide zinc metalloprotease protein
MKTETPASDLERRKKVRLRIRGDLGITPQKYEGRTYYVVKDPVSLRYYRFKEQEHFLIKLMDGTHTLDDAQKEFEKRFRPDRLTLEDLEAFGQQLLTAGLAQNESPQAGKQLFDRRKKRRRSELMQALTNILYIKIPVFDPEKLLNRMLPYTRWMFTFWFLMLSVGVMLGAILLVLTHFQTFRDRLPSYHEFFSFKTVMYLWLALGIVKVIHEFGHGLSCKAFGGEVHEMGFLFLCFSPCMYCNVSDAWTLPSKWKRIIISGAGIYVELMIAAIATFVWWNTPSEPFINYLSLSLMVVCSVSTVVFNGNPLMRYDGYYVLADWLEIPNLRDRSNRYLQRLVMAHCLGIEVQPEPYMALWRRILFVGYAVVSYVYRWVVTFVILWFMYNFLKPYKLGVISAMLAMMAAGSMVGWPLYRLGKNIHKRGRLPDMKTVRVAISGSVVAAVLFFICFVPMPYFSRVRQTGLVQVQPDSIVKVQVRATGILEEIPPGIIEGKFVQKGTLLARFSNRELLSQEIEYESQYLMNKKRAEKFEAELAKASDPKEKELIKENKLSAEQERNEAEVKWLHFRNFVLREQLELRAPRDGVIVGLPQVTEIGKLWDKEQSPPFCSIADPTRLRVLVPVPPADYELIRSDLADLQAKKQDLAVTIRVKGRDSLTWTGKVTHLPRAKAEEIPVHLSNKAGGPLAIKPGSPPNHYIPQAQQYLVGIDFQSPDQAVCPGALAQVKVHCESRTCLWWVWRTISDTFDLGLL